MSADNWATCPQCVKNRKDSIDQLRARVVNAYGKVSQQEYDQLVADLDSKQATKTTETTLREYYEIGIFGSPTFEVTYRVSCNVCSYSFTYEHEENVPLS